MATFLLLLAQANMIPMLIHLLIVIIVLGIIFWLLWWALSYLPLPAPFSQIVRFLLVLIFVLTLIYLILPLLSIH
jgi:hypothetical protein